MGQVGVTCCATRTKENYRRCRSGFAEGRFDFNKHGPSGVEQALCVDDRLLDPSKLPDSDAPMKTATPRDANSVREPDLVAHKPLDDEGCFFRDSLAVGDLRKSMREEPDAEGVSPEKLAELQEKSRLLREQIRRFEVPAREQPEAPECVLNFVYMGNGELQLAEGSLPKLGCKVGGKAKILLTNASEATLCYKTRTTQATVCGTDPKQGLLGKDEQVSISVAALLPDFKDSHMQLVVAPAGEVLSKDQWSALDKNKISKRSVQCTVIE